MARAIIRHDDLAGQRAWLDAIRAETYTGMPRRLPRITRPKPPAQAPQPLLFACLPELPSPPKSVELPRAVARPAAPEFSPLTPEDVQALEIYAKGIAPGYPEAYGSMWNAFVLNGARPVPIDVLVTKTVQAALRLTRTRLGWTAGYELTVDGSWSGDGGFQHPNCDVVGWFMWDSRHAAERAAAHALLSACADSGVAQRIRDSLARLGIDGSEEPGETAKLRLISRAHAAAITAAGPSERELAIQDPGPSEDVRAYERALGLTDVDGPPPEPPKKKRASKPTELPIVKARPAEPVPDEFSAEELAEIEAFVADGQKHGSVGDAARKRWDAWIMAGRTVERKITRLPGVQGHADVQVLETRLGWAANVCYATTKNTATHVWLLHRPEIDTDCRYFWRTLDAAIAYSANMAWKVGLEHQGHERARRSWARFADEMRAFLARCGIDVTVPPPQSMKRILITAARERELKAGAPPAQAPAPAATTPPPAQAPADPKPKAAEEQPQPPRIERDRKRTLAQVVAGAGVLSMREPTLPDRTEIHAAIGEALPPGVPTYVRDIVAVNRAPGQKGGRIIADLRLFDGAVGRIEISGQPGGRGYRWHSSGIERTAFHWDERARSWVRVSEPK